MSPQETLQLQVEGMSCGHCEMTVVKALTALDGVVSAKADHASGKVQLTIEAGRRPSDEALAAAIDQAGYGLMV